MNRDFEQLSTLYEATLMNLDVIEESPDNITVNYDGNRQTVSYYSDGNITALIDFEGNFVGTIANKGHGNLRMVMRRQSEEGVESDIKTNNKSALENLRMRGKEVRVWPKYKVFSSWTIPSTENLPAIWELFKAYNLNPKEYKFDVDSNADGIYEDMLDYDRFVASYKTESEAEAKAKKEEEMKREQEALERQRMMANYQLGLNRRQGMYSREGD